MLPLSHDAPDIFFFLSCHLYHNAQHSLTTVLRPVASIHLVLNCTLGCNAVFDCKKSYWHRVCQLNVNNAEVQSINIVLWYEQRRTTYSAHYTSTVQHELLLTIGTVESTWVHPEHVQYRPLELAQNLLEYRGKVLFPCLSWPVALKTIYSITMLLTPEFPGWCHHISHISIQTPCCNTFCTDAVWMLEHTIP